MSKTTKQANDFFLNLEPWKQHLAVFLVLFVVPFFMFSSTTLGDKQVIGHDTIQWKAADKSISDYREKHPSKDALWAPNSFSGMPAYVISGPSKVPNIDTLLRSLSPYLYPVVYFWVLLGGAYFLFILLKINPIAAALGAVFISFTNYIPVIIEAGHVTKFLSYAFIPWVLAGYVMLTSSSKKLMAFFVFTLALTLEARAGHPQVLYYFLYLLFFWWAYDSYLKYKTNQIKNWGLTTLLIGLAGLLALLTNLEHYWSLYEYTQFSTRGGSELAPSAEKGLSLEYAFVWSHNFGELLTLIIPGLFGGSSGEAYWGPKPFTSGPHYLGAIAFLLAIFGVIKSKNSLRFVFLGTGLLAALFSLGKFFPLLNDTMFKVMPLFNKFRTPEMWLIVTVVCFSILAVFGLNEILHLAKNKSRKLNDLFVPLGIAIAFMLLFTLGSKSLLSFDKPGEIEAIAQQNNVSANNPQVRSQIIQLIDTRIKPARIELATSDSYRFALLILFGSGLIIAFYLGYLRKELFLAGIFILGAYDMISLGNRYLSSDKMVESSKSVVSIIEQQKRTLDEFIINNIGTSEGYQYRVLPLLDNPFNNAIPAYFYPSLGGYTAAKLSSYQDLIDQLLFSGPSGINPYVLSMLNTKFITVGQELSLPFLLNVYQEEGSFIYENLNVMPKAFFTDSVVTVSSPVNAISKLKSISEFSPKQLIVIETDEVLSSSYDSTAIVNVAQYDPQHIILNTVSDKNQFLVLSEIFYPVGWEALINGVPTQIYKTNYVLRGINVPAGNNNIEFIFKPKSNIWGKRISWASSISIFFIGLLGLFFALRNRKDSEILT